MLIERWEQLRGYDRWTPAMATVRTVTLSHVGGMGSENSNASVALGWESECKITWKDQNQIDHSATFKAFEESQLYQQIEGDTVEIRFNPANPSEYYLRGLVQSDLARKWKLTVYLAMIALLCIAMLIFLLAH